MKFTKPTLKLVRLSDGRELMLGRNRTYNVIFYHNIYSKRFSAIIGNIVIINYWGIIGVLPILFTKG